MLPFLVMEGQEGHPLENALAGFMHQATLMCFAWLQPRVACEASHCDLGLQRCVNPAMVAYQSLGALRLTLNQLKLAAGTLEGDNPRVLGALGLIWGWGGKWICRKRRLTASS